MGGDDSQKLLALEGNLLLSGAQQTSGSQRNQYCNGKLRWNLAGRHFPGPDGSWLSYRLPGSFLQSRPGSLLASAETVCVSNEPTSLPFHVLHRRQA